MAKINTTEHFDNIIVGAGAAGMLLATRLAEAGQQVLVIEAGPDRQLMDLQSSQIWARKLKWSGADVLEAGNHPVGHAFNAGYGAGGSALHHYGVWLRLHEGDFTVATDHHLSLDWPIRYSDLRPFYDRIQSEVGLSGDAKAESWRPDGAPYPMPPLPVFAQGQALKKGFDALNIETAPLAVAINSVPYKGRAACLYDGWCDAGCPIGALANPLVVWRPRALKAGAVFRYDCEATRLINNASHHDVCSGIEVLEHGVKKQLSADRVIVAAFTVQTVRLLLNSATEHKPAPGNERDQLGRYLTSHPAGTVYGIMPTETSPHMGVSAGQLMSHHEYDQRDRKDGSFGAFQWLIAHAIKPNDLLGYATGRADLIGQDLKPWLQNAAKHLANMTVVAEDISSADNRITLSDQTDPETGMPLAATVHNLDKRSIKLWDNKIAEGESIMRAAGATEVWHGPRIGMHIMGGTVMGTDPANSVTDSFGRLHEFRNLYVAGPSLFPSSGAVNPTFTISAIADRQAEHLMSAP